MKLKMTGTDNPDRKGIPVNDKEAATTNDLAKPLMDAKRQLNIVVSEETLRDFRIYSAAHGISKSQLWQQVWEEWRARNP